ncbi:MAG: hypothetical protein ABSH51_00155 [Solirubrobacteraceae bacterium]
MTATRLRAGAWPAPRATDTPRRRDALWPLGLYAALSLVLFGGPVVGHLDSRIIASDTIDSSQFMWFFAWWPHALLHGLNPFVTHVMFVPSGFNLTWSTAMPGPAILLSPVTLAFGPAVTWNVIQLASPALSAWTAFLLCRELTGRVGPSLAGGYVFGFSPYMLIHLTGGPYLALAALVPVFVWLVALRLRDAISRRRFVIAMALALTGQYLISSEVLATSALFGVLALVLAFVLLPAARRALRELVPPLAGAFAITAVLISPFLYYFFFGQHYPPAATHFPADLASYALPSPLMAITRRAPMFVGSNTEGYLGVGLIVLVAIFAWEQRRTRAAWVVTLSIAAAGLCTLGAHLLVRGHKTSIPMPWLVLSHLPVLRYAIPVRLALFVDLPVAVIVALFLSPEQAPPRPAGRGRLWRWGLAAVAVALILPDVGNVAWNVPVADPAFFASGAYRSYLKATDNVVTIPAWGPNERWQADTGFAFNLSDGYAGNPFPAAYARFPTWNTLLTGQLTPGWPAQLRRFVAAKHVTAIVVEEGVPGPWRTLFATLGARPISTGGVLFYRLRRAPPGP